MSAFRPPRHRRELGDVTGSIGLSLREHRDDDSGRPFRAIPWDRAEQQCSSSSSDRKQYCQMAPFTTEITIVGPAPAGAAASRGAP
jgi:hypothetical protein